MFASQRAGRLRYGCCMCRIWVRALLFSICVGCGCGGTRSANRTPEVGGWLQLEGDEGQNGSFAVVSASPQGKVDSSQPISVVFSHPLRTLNTADLVAPPPIQIDPPIPGAWQWVGTNAVTLVGPTALLNPATTYHVVVSGSARDVLGRTLGMPYLYQFETERPKLLKLIGEPQTSRKLTSVRAPRARFKSESVEVPICSRFSDSKQLSDLPEGPWGIVPLKPKDHLFALFNLPMDSETLRDTITLSAVPKSNASNPEPALIAFDASMPCADYRQLIELSPKEPLPTASTIRITTQPALRAAVGDLPAGESQTESLETYGPLEAFVQYEPKSGCHGGLLSFSNPVDLHVVKRSLSIRPKLKFSIEEVEVMDRAFCINGKFDHDKSYTASFDRPVTDDYGQPLTGERELKLTFDHRERISSVGAVEHTKKAGGGFQVPLLMEGVDRLRTKVVAISPTDLNRFYEQKPKDDSFASLLESLPGKTETFDLGKRHWLGALPLRNSIGDRSFGSFGLLVQADDTAPDAELMHATDLAMVAVLSPKQGLVWVARQSDATPVVGARLVAYFGTDEGKVLSPRTDAHGMAQLDAATVKEVLERGPQTIVAAETEQDSTYVNCRWLEPVKDELTDTATAFADRGIYRPGDPIRVKGWIWHQTEHGAEPAPQVKVTLRLVRSHQNTEDADVALLKAEPSTNEFGGFTTRWEIPKNAPLDDYRLEVTSGHTRAWASLRIAEYRPVEYSASVTPESTNAYRNSNLQYRVQGKYLMGTPMRGAQLTYSTERTPVTQQLVEGFVTNAFDTDLFEPSESPGNPEDEKPFRRAWRRGLFRRAGPNRGDATRLRLDASGQMTLQVRADGYPEGPTDFALFAEISDDSQQVVGANATLRVHPASFYLGLRPHDESVSLHQPIDTEVIAFTPDGRRLGGKKVKVQLLSVARDPDSDTLKSKSEGHCEVATDSGHKVGCQVRATTTGPHVLMVSAFDENGREVRAGERVGIVDAPNVRHAPTKNVDDAEPLLELDRSVYHPGDTLHATVGLPGPKQSLLVTLETHRILWWRRIDPSTQIQSPRSQVLDIPIPESVVRNATVMVYRIEPPRAPRQFPGRLDPVVGPFLKKASAEFTIDPELDRLGVEIAPAQSTVAPGSKISVALRVTDRRGVGIKSEVALLAVDEGVLNLTGYEVRDPLLTLLGERPHAVEHLDSRTSGDLFMYGTLGAMGRVGPGDCGPFGGENCGKRPVPPDASRQRFPGTVYFNPSIVTDERGTASVNVALGDAVTSYRLMAVAVSRHGQAGAHSTAVSVRQALMVRPTLPRLLRAGDRVEAGVMVMNESTKPADVVVTLAVKGLSEQIPASRSIRLEPGAAKHLEFTSNASAVGTAEFKFTANNEQLHDSVTVRIPVEAPLPAQVVAAYGSTHSTAVERIGELRSARRDSGELEVQLASTALLGVDRGLKQLARDDGPNSEQLTSSVLPALLFGELEKAFGIAPTLTSAELTKRLRLLLGFQMGDGIGLWPGATEPHPWVSCYALLALTRASDLGLISAPESLKRLRRYVAHFLEDEITAARARGRPVEVQLQQSVGPFAAFVLSQNGAVTWSQLDRLWAQRRQMSIASKALLLDAIANYKPLDVPAPNRQEKTAELAAELVASLHFDGPRVVLVDPHQPGRGNFDSDTRSLALVLSALLAVDAHHALAERLVKTLLDARHHGEWRSTQESAFVLLALDKYRRVREPSVPRFDAKMWLGNRLLGAFDQQGASLTVRRVTVPMHEIDIQGARLSVALQGQGDLYYETRLNYVPAQLPASAVDRGFFVARQLTVANADPAASVAHPSLEFDLGELVHGEVIVTTPTPRDYVRLAVPIAAGMELIDSELETTPAGGNTREGSPELDPRVAAKLGMKPQPGMLPIDPPKTAAVTLAPKPGYASHVELRDGQAVYFIDRLPIGAYRYRYLMRATTRGRFVVPPSVAEELYAPEVMGRTAADQIVVR